MTPFSAHKISEHVYWVGAIDHEIRNFHGYSTSHGTTYNAFLIIKNDCAILIDTVKKPFFNEMMSRIASVIDPQKITHIISNHAEMDHSGSLQETIQAVNPEKVFASKAGVNALKAHFHFTDDIITPVENGSTLTLGHHELMFLETKMLHWPDSMFTFFPKDGILFSQDALGMHLATHQLFADKNDYDVMQHEAAKYYANILLPYSNFVSKLLEKLPSLNLDIKIIAPDHGPMWRTQKDIEWILTHWKNWSAQKKQPKIVITYDTMWQSTALMARTIADGAMDEQGVVVKILPLSGSHRSDIAVELLDAKALLVGSPTINQQMFPTVSDVLCYLKGLKPKNLMGQAFGSYGWAGEGVKLVKQTLEEMEIKLIGEPITAQYVPNNEKLIACKNFGKMIAARIKSE